MIKFEHTETSGWEAAIRGSRNPLQSWEKSDSFSCCGEFSETLGGKRVVCEGQHCPGWWGDMCQRRDDLVIGPNDRELLMKLAKAGPDHGKALRMISVTVDITAPLYWWKQMDQYKVGTVTNSTSTMHTIHKRDLTPDDFSTEAVGMIGWKQFNDLLEYLNWLRAQYVETKETEYWESMIALLPSCYNQMRTWSGNYAVLRTIYHQRVYHKLTEWPHFCRWAESLPYSELIIEV